MESGPRGDRKFVLVAIAGAGCISSSPVLVQLASQSPVTTAAFRCLIALPFLGLLAALEARRRGRRPTASHAKALGAGLFLALDLVLWNHSIADVGAGAATVLGNLQILFVGFAAWLILGEKPGRRLVLAIPVVATGVVLVSGLAGRTSFGRHPVGGILYGLGTSVAYTAFLLILRAASTGTPHVAGPLFEATVGAAAGSLLIGAAVGGLTFEPPWPGLGWLIVLALVSQVLGWLLIASSLPRLPAAVSSLLLLLQPAAAMLLAAVVLSQVPTALQVFGASLVCCGVLAAVWHNPATQPASDNLLQTAEELRT
jgi:drug/metabolite transporter (DMT)-like permease